MTKHPALSRSARVLLAGALIGLSGQALAQTAPSPQPAKPKAAQAPARAPAAQAPARAPAAPQATGDVVARVGDRELTADDIRAFVRSLGPREQVAIAREPALLTQTVRALLANSLVLKEALAKKWDQQPTV